MIAQNPEFSSRKGDDQKGESRAPAPDLDDTGPLQSEDSTPSGSDPAKADQLQNVRPPGGFIHEWNWGEGEDWPPVYRDDEAGIAYIRISECPPKQQQELKEWVMKYWVTQPVLPELGKDYERDVVYAWDYAAFLEGKEGDFFW